MVLAPTWAPRPTRSTKERDFRSQERLRVARALGTLPQLAAALARGELPFSVVRELTRVATPLTEAAWREAATGKNLREIEELVADHRPGDQEVWNRVVCTTWTRPSSPRRLHVNGPTLCGLISSDGKP